MVALQVGRAIGPLAATFLLSLGNRTGASNVGGSGEVASGVGPQYVYLLMIFGAGLGLWVPLLDFDYMYRGGK